jgi:hypothetical protein
MAYSKNTYPGDGATTEFALEFPYLETDHVGVTVDGIATAFTWLNASTVVISPAPALDAVIVISRDSSRADRISTYANLQMLTMSDLNYDALQNFYMAQEAFDQAQATAGGTGGGDMLGSFNLSDVNSPSAARANIGALASTNPEITGSLTLDDAPSDPLHAVTKAYVDAAIAAIPAGTGEVNTGSNLGGGVPVFKGKAGVDFEHYTLAAAAGATVTAVGNTIQIGATGVGGGEVNDGANVNVTGIPVFTTKSGVALQFKGVGVADATIDSTSSTAADILLKVNRATSYAWTDAHTFTKAALSNAPAMKIESLGNGSLPSSGATLNTGYVGAVDIKMTSNAATAGNANNIGGGIHSLYVQHDIAGISPGTNTRLFGAIRAQLTGKATGVATEYTAFYANAQNESSVANYAWNYFCDVVHANSHAASRTFGFAAEVIRLHANGGVYGYNAQMMNLSTSAGTAGFLLSNQPTSGGNTRRKWTCGISFGDASNESEVDYGIDMAYSTINAVAIRIPALVPMVWSGLDSNARSQVYNSASNRMEFQYAGTNVFDIPIHTSSTKTYAFGIKTTAASNFVKTDVTDGAATPRNPQGYVRFQIDGVNKRFAYYAD